MSITGLPPSHLPSASCVSVSTDTADATTNKLNKLNEKIFRETKRTKKSGFQTSKYINRLAPVIKAVKRIIMHLLIS